jgi:hypothetical protein
MSIISYRIESIYAVSIEEAEFLRGLIDISPVFSEKKQLVNLIKDTTNRKITDYLWLIQLICS